MFYLILLITMKKSKLKLAETMLQHTTAFELKQIDYIKDKDTIIIWSVNSHSGSLHCLGLVPMFKSLFNCLASYNENKKRVEMVVF